MCGCFDIFDFVCFFTFFITAIVALLFVQYFFVYLDFETENKTAHFGRCMYFLILTFLGCLVFAGVQRRSICLLKWPSRFLVSLITLGLICLTLFLWTLDRVHKQSVRDLEVKTAKLSLVVLLVVFYLGGVQKLINLIQIANSNNTNANLNYVFGIDHNHTHTHSGGGARNSANSANLVDAFRSQKLKSGNSTSGLGRQFNADSNGVNYYKLLLEGANSTSSNSGKLKKYSPRPSKVGSLASLSICSGEIGVISQV